MISLQEINELWNAFFFSSTPVYTLALFRIVFGLILLYEALFLLPNIKEYYGPNGLIKYDRYYNRNKGKFLSLFLYLPATMRSVYIVFGIHILLLLLMIGGLFTNFVIIGVYITLCSIVNRNPTICNGGDNVARIMIFLLIFSSSGNAFSLDSYLFNSAGIGQSLSLIQPIWPLRLMQIQVSIIYLFTFYWKLKGQTYINGTAVYYVMGNHTYTRLPLPSFFVKTPIVQISTWSILIIEFALGAGIWISEFRHPIVLIGILFHFAIEFILNVHLFGWFMIACLLLFIDPNYVLEIVNSFIR
jgi:hypothetical protein